MWGPSTSDCSHQIIIHPSPPVSLGLKLLPTHPSQVQDLSAACSRLEDANLQLAASFEFVTLPLDDLADYVGDVEHDE